MTFTPTEEDKEKASNGYLMSMIGLMGGVPLPIINFLATFYFFFANRKSRDFVRWHCLQALLSQLACLGLNSYGFWWTMSVIFTDTTASNGYFSYLAFLLLFNVLELSATIYACIHTRKGRHIEWLFFGTLTNLIFKANDTEVDR